MKNSDYSLFKFIVKRLLFFFFSMWAVATFTFILMHKLPGSPFVSKTLLTTRIEANLEAKYGLDKPLHTQYFIYMSNLLKGDLGVSMVYSNKSVGSIIARTFPVSLDLGLRAFVIAVFAGLSLGTLSAVYHGKWFDYFGLTIAIIGVSIPGFICGTLVQYLLCFKLSNDIQNIAGSGFRFLPVTGWGSIRHTIAPALALSFGAFGVIARMMRSSMLEVLKMDYIKAARAKGIYGVGLIMRHGFRNAVIPVISVIGPMAAALIMGSFIIENIFSIPGLGRYFVSSVQAKDYTMVTGLAVFTVFIVVIINTITDIAYSLVDPRVRVYGKKE